MLPAGEFDDLTVTIRTTKIVVKFMLGAKLTTKQVAEITGLTPRGALYLLNGIAIALPIYEIGGVWQMQE